MVNAALDQARKDLAEELKNRDGPKGAELLNRMAKLDSKDKKLNESWAENFPKLWKPSAKSKAKSHEPKKISAS